MKHFTSPSFWNNYNNLSKNIQKLSDEKFSLLKENTKHPSLHFKKINKYYSVRINTSYRSLGVVVETGILWVWIGNHDDYDKIIN